MTDSAERQTVLTGFLLGGPIAELAVVSVDEHDGRRLRIYAFAGSAWRPSLDITLGPEVRFVDLANIGGEDRLVTYEPGRLSWLDPKHGTEELLVAVPSDFESPRPREVPHVDITRDVNGDGRDDLVVPDSAGFQVFVQAGDGTFANPVSIGPPTDISRIRGADGYRYDPWTQSRVHAIAEGTSRSGTATTSRCISRKRTAGFARWPRPSRPRSVSTPTSSLHLPPEI